MGPFQESQHRHVKVKVHRSDQRGEVQYKVVTKNIENICGELQKN